MKINTLSPIFGGSTGGWLKAAEIEEKYTITWTSSKEQIFEMPTGGAGIMLKGENFLYFARKEQCVALSAQLRTMKINDYKIFRLIPSGEVQFLHPNDGVFPEKVNDDRERAGFKNFSIGKNPEPSLNKFGREPGSVAAKIEVMVNEPFITEKDEIVRQMAVRYREDEKEE